MKRCPKCEKTYDRTVEFCPTDGTSLVPVSKPKVDPMLGHVLANRYRLIEKIGEGGMGSVYKAIHLRMDRVCAIKMLTAISSDSEASLERFNREARMASRIDNPHAVTIYDFGEAEGGALYLAMEYVEGKLLTRLISEQGKLGPSRVAHIAAQISEALSAAHALGIIHRDLKPDNIMVTRKGAEADYVKVLDFGIAKTVAEDGAENLTRTGFVLGTPAYMSPEQLAGERVDGRSDVYSLAIIVYEMLSGRLPFVGDNPQAIMVKRLMSDPIPLRAADPSVSDSIEQAVMDGLARDRNSRTPSAEAFANALRSALQVGTQVLNVRATSALTDEGTALGTQEWVTLGESESPALPPSDTLSFHAEPGDEKSPLPEDDPSAIPSEPFNTNRTRAAQTGGAFEPPGGDLKASGLTTSGQGERLTLQESQPLPSPAVTSVEQPVSGTRRAVIAAATVLVFAVLGALLFFLLNRGPKGYTVVVRGAPAGSEVFLNNVRRGVTAADGTLSIEVEEMGEIPVRVSQAGFADFTTTLSGKEGEEKTIESNLLPFIVEYSGKMILIPAGEFFMGDDNHEPNEAPGHKVSLPDFYIDKFEVTNGQYRKFSDQTKRPYPSNAWNPSYFADNPDSPVLGVSWDDAMAYAKWAGKRLPREEEWEKAASWDPATLTKRQWPWGNSAGQGNAFINRDSRAPEFAAVGTHPRDASPYGVMDMGGNAAEWVDSFYLPYEGNKKPDPEYGNKNFRVVRGGFSTGNENEARTTSRLTHPWQAKEGEKPRWLVGFRCAVSADDPAFQGYLRAQGN